MNTTRLTGKTKGAAMSEDTKDEILGLIILSPLLIWGTPKVAGYVYNSVKTAVVKELHKGISVDMEKLHTTLTGKPLPF